MHNCVTASRVCHVTVYLWPSGKQPMNVSAIVFVRVLGWYFFFKLPLKRSLFIYY